MRALRLNRPGIDGLSVDEIDVPEVGPGEALVRVHAAALTRDELDWPVDRLPAVPSYELSGVVETVAPGVSDVEPGDAVYALTPFDRDGAAADYTVVPAALLAPKPQTLDHVESAAVPLAALSAWQGLFDHGRLDAGERVVVTGPAGGVGHFAVQLARHRGAEIVAPGAAADLVFDTAGGEELAAARAGRTVSVAEEADGATYFVVEPNRSQLVELARLVDSEAVRPAIDSVFPLTDARAAFQRTMQRGKRGKVVLRIADHDRRIG
jgi:NADPH:quinone reductase-like Zn-dependent oxidoreductase